MLPRAPSCCSYPPDAIVHMIDFFRLEQLFYLYAAITLLLYLSYAGFKDAQPPA
jgi:hypothetical protein